MATEQRRKQNETISGILKLLKSTNYKGGNKRDLKSDLMMATEDKTFLNVLHELQSTITNESIVSDEELQKQQEVQSSSVKSLPDEIDNVNLSLKEIEEEILQAEERLKESKSANHKLSYQVEFLNNELENSRKEQQSLEFILLNKKDEMSSLETNLQSANYDLSKMFQELHEEFSEDNDNWQGEDKDACSFISASLDKIIESEEKNLSMHTDVLKHESEKFNSSIVDEDKEDMNVTPLSFYNKEGNYDHSNDENKNKHELLKSVMVSILGYIPRKLKLITARCESAANSAKIEKLEHFEEFHPSDFYSSIEGEQTAVEQLEIDISKNKELIGEEMRRLERILNVGLKLEREEVMGGEYRQLLHKLQKFHRKQAQVKKFLVEQFACYYLTWLLIETEKSQLESRRSTISKLVELLREDTADLERQNDLLRKLPDLNDAGGDLISNEDVCVANIHDSLVPEESSAGKEPFRRYSSAEEAAVHLCDGSETFKEKLGEYDLSHDSYTSFKDVLDNLCSESDDSKFDIKLAEQSTSDGLKNLKANYDSLEKSIKSVLNKVEQKKNYLNSNPELLEEKYSWLDTEISFK